MGMFSSPGLGTCSGDVQNSGAVAFSSTQPRTASCSGVHLPYQDEGARRRVSLLRRLRASSHDAVHTLRAGWRQRRWRQRRSGGGKQGRRQACTPSAAPPRGRRRLALTAPSPDMCGEESGK